MADYEEMDPRNLNPELLEMLEGTPNKHSLAIVIEAVASLGERNGSLRKSICNYISSTYDVDHDLIRTKVKKALRQAVKLGLLTKDNSGYYKLAFDDPDAPARPQPSARKPGKGHCWWYRGGSRPPGGKSRRQGGRRGRSASKRRSGSRSSSRKKGGAATSRRRRKSGSSKRRGGGRRGGGAAASKRRRGGRSASRRRKQTPRRKASGGTRRKRGGSNAATGRRRRTRAATPRMATEYCDRHRRRQQRRERDCEVGGGSVLRRGNTIDTTLSTREEDADLILSDLFRSIHRCERARRHERFLQERRQRELQQQTASHRVLCEAVLVPHISTEATGGTVLGSSTHTTSSTLAAGSTNTIATTTASGNSGQSLLARSVSEIASSTSLLLRQRRQSRLENEVDENEEDATDDNDDKQEKELYKNDRYNSEDDNMDN